MNSETNQDEWGLDNQKNHNHLVGRINRFFQKGHFPVCILKNKVSLKVSAVKPE